MPPWRNGIRGRLRACALMGVVVRVHSGAPVLVVDDGDARRQASLAARHSRFWTLSMTFRAASSVGRASALHAESQGFESLAAHQG